MGFWYKGETMRDMKSQSFLASFLAVLLVGGTYAISQINAVPSAPTEPSTKASAGFGEQDVGTEPSEERAVPFIEFEGPLFRGEKIPLEVATILLRECRCPQLPSTGPASSEHVVQAWFDRGLGKVALEFDNRLTMIFSHDGGTPEEFVAGVQAMIDTSEWVGHFVPLRGTTAAGTDILENGRIATLGWIEGADIINLYGEGGQTLAELISVAESLVYSG
jgi:hypothetical protein